MDRLIYTAMSGAKQAFLQQAGVAQNLANATTTGYRAMEHRFRAVPVLGAGADAGLRGRRLGGQRFEQGPLTTTGRPLDVAVRGRRLDRRAGSDGREAYTRAGNLKTDANGVLQTSSGFNVLGEGGPISLPPDNNIVIATTGRCRAFRASARGRSTTSMWSAGSSWSIRRKTIWCAAMTGCSGPATACRRSPTRTSSSRPRRSRGATSTRWTRWSG
jgi:flagellar hook-basal body protein